MDSQKLAAYCDGLWERSALPTLIEYIKIPNRSPDFDAQWAEHGYMDQAVSLIAGWCGDHAPAGMSLEVVRLEGRTPLIFMEVPGTGGEGTVLLYGHLDKQPEMVGWDEGLGPWKPVLRGEKLYGRGGADDGYAAFASIAALKALEDQGVPHARCVILIEACEESGSYDLPAYIDHLADRIGCPELVVCLDSGCGTYDRLWLTTSLRGMVMGELSVQILEEGVHSGDAGGVVPSSFRILRQLLDRLEDPISGELKVPTCHVEIPAARKEQARATAEVLEQSIWQRFPFVEGGYGNATDPYTLILNRTWRPTLSVTGAAGLPAIADAGNVQRPRTSVKLSMRIPPTTNPDAAFEAIRQTLLADPPYGARISFEGEAMGGWNSPDLAPWLEAAISAASEHQFGAPMAAMGEGGSIPFMGMLGEKFPQAQFMITGVLGPGSNAHGPNEFLHLPTARRLSACVAEVIAAHNRR